MKKTKVIVYVILLILLIALPVGGLYYYANYHNVLDNNPTKVEASLPLEFIQLSTVDFMINEQSGWIKQDAIMVDRNKNVFVTGYAIVIKKEKWWLLKITKKDGKYFVSLPQEHIVQYKELKDSIPKQFM